MNKNFKGLLSDTVILAFGTFTSKLLVILLMPLYTKYLTPDMYSTADLISQTANLLIPFACLGITEAVFRFSLDTNKNNKAVLSTGFFVLLAGILLFLLLSPILSLFSKFSSFTWLIILYVINSNFHSLLAQYVRALGKTKLFALQGIINTAITIILNISFIVFFKMGIVGYVLSVIIADALVTIILAVIIKPLKLIKIKYVTRTLLKEMLSYCIPLIPTTVFWWITNVSDRYIVSIFCGDSVNGLYAAAYKIPTLLTLAAAVFNEAWQRFAFTEKKSMVCTTQVEETDSDESNIDETDKKSDKTNSYYFERTFASFSSIMLIACTVLILLAKPLTDFFLAQTYKEAWVYVPVLLIATVFTSLVTFFSSVYALKKRTVMSLLTALLGATINIILNILLIPKYGANGAALATLICYMTVFVIRSINIKKYVTFKIYTPCFIISVVLVSLQCAAILFCKSHTILIQVCFCISIICFNLPELYKTIETIFTKN